MITLENTHRKDGDEDIYVLTIDGTPYKGLTLPEALEIIRNTEEKK